MENNILKKYQFLKNKVKIKKNLEMGSRELQEFYLLDKNEKNNTIHE